MPARRSFSTRPLDRDDPAVDALAEAAGAHGVYVRNALASGEGEGVLCCQGDTVRAVCWFGPRGNLVVLGASTLESTLVPAIVDAVQQARLAWRIAMGPAQVIDGLRERISGKPLVWRDQVYYAGIAADAPAANGIVEVRLAQRADRDRLVQATLLLNHSDLNIEPGKVDRRWLRDTIDERIAEGTSRLLGPIGAPRCKLDFGSEGPGGLMIEGVFTFPEHRGKGLATTLVAACLRDAPGFVCLHVGRHNAPARAAYERAGLQVVGECRLLLLG